MLHKHAAFDLTFRVSDDIYQGFIRVFKDRNPLHVDESFALDRGFKGKVMHGNILNGFLSYFIGECLPEKDVIIHSQEIKYLRPVYLNDVLTLRAHVHDIFESVNVAEIKFVFMNSESAKVAKGKISIGILR